MGVEIFKYRFEVGECLKGSTESSLARFSRFEECGDLLV
jgi:hypothetical protein